MNMDAINKQRLEELAGVRSARVASRAAVRKSDLAPLVSLAKAVAAKAAGSAPTAAEYDALLADVQALRAAIDQIAVKVKT